MGKFEELIREIKEKRDVLCAMKFSVIEQEKKISSLASEVQSICSHKWKEIYLYRGDSTKSGTNIGRFCPVCEKFEKRWVIWDESCDYCYKRDVSLSVTIIRRGDGNICFHAHLRCSDCGAEMRLFEKP